MNINQYIEVFTRDLKANNYSRNTIKAYTHWLKRYLKYTALHPKLDPGDRIRDFLAELNDDSTACRVQAYNSIKLFYLKVLKKPCPYTYKKPRRRKRLPVVYSKKEVQMIINAPANFQHRIILKMIYASGLRVSEDIKIKIKDLDLQNNRLIIRRAKGDKDRITVLSDNLKPELDKIMNGKAGNEYLFQTNRGKPYHVRSIQTLFKESAQKAGLVEKNGSCHSLRHSFATHLVQNGISIQEISALLGHSNLKTTMVYVHMVSNWEKKIKSPLDI